MIVNLCPVSPNHHPRISDDVVNIGHLKWSSLKRDNGQSIELARLGMNTTKGSLCLQLCPEVVLERTPGTNKLDVCTIPKQGRLDVDSNQWQVNSLKDTL